MVSFAEPEKLAFIFDGENRQQWQNTDHILATLDIKQNEVVADVGAGTGYFCQQFVSRTGVGHIYAIDLEANMVAYLENRFIEEPRISCLSCTADDPSIPEGVDTVFLANSYRFIKDRKTFLAKLKEQITAEARVVIVDFKGSNARVTPEMAIQEVKDAGFEIVNFDRDGCPDHYILSSCLKP